MDTDTQELARLERNIYREAVLKSVEDGETNPDDANLSLAAHQAAKALIGEQVFSVMEFAPPNDVNLNLIAAGKSAVALQGVVLVSQKRSNPFSSEVTHLDLEAIGCGGNAVKLADVSVSGLNAFLLTKYAYRLVMVASRVKEMPPTEEARMAAVAQGQATIGQRMVAHLAQNSRTV